MDFGVLTAAKNLAGQSGGKYSLLKTTYMNEQGTIDERVKVKIFH